MASERLVLAAAAAGARMLRRTLSEGLARRQVDEQVAGDLSLAVWEAFSNAVLHGSPQPDARIEAHIQFLPDRCSVTLVYPGEPFALTPPSLPGPWATGGRGRYLMAVLLDEVDYTFESGFTRVRLVKRFPRD